jgi:uncharacterized protein YjiS (DUF1127 family)
MVSPSIAAARAQQRNLFERAVASVAGKFSAWLEAQRVRASLEQMTDRELADMGITRSDIGSIVSGRHR